MIKALIGVDLENVLVVDIETASIEQELTEDSRYYDSWAYKMRHSKEADQKGYNEDIITSFAEKSPLYSEFSRIICISIGHIKPSEGVIKVSSFYEGCNDKIKDEAGIITAFNNALDAFQSSRKKTMLCGHSIIAFDVPTIYKRSIILGIPPHSMVDTSTDKPWTVTERLLDTKTVFQGTSFTPPSLISLAAAFGLENPKQDITGSETSTAYYSGQITRVARYCERDVVTTANILLKMMFLPTVEKKMSDLDFTDVPLLEKVAKLGKYIKEEAVKVVGIYDVLEENEKPIAEKLIEISFKKSLEELRNVK